MTPGELAYLNEIRKGMDLPELKPGKTTCLKCGKTFNSECIKLIRLCQYCKTENEADGIAHEPCYLDDLTEYMSDRHLDMHGSGQVRKLPVDQDHNH